MLIHKTIIYKYSIPIVPFTIATGTMHFAQNTLVKIFADKYIGYGECSAFPMITGETQATCFEMGKDFAQILLNQDVTAIDKCMQALHSYTAGNATIKSAFDIALYDINAQAADLPLYKYLGGTYRTFPSDITVGIDTPEQMALQAKGFVDNGATILKIKLGKNSAEDVERIKAIRAAIGMNCTIRIDANQGYTFKDALIVFKNLEPYQIQFCEQPMRTYLDEYLPQLRKATSIPMMADESVYNHHDTERLIKNDACDSINIKLAKSGGILEARNIIKTAEANNIPLMMGGMLESRLALTAFAHLACCSKQFQFFDLDTCLLGHKIDPVLGGAQFAHGYNLVLDENTPGIGATVDDGYLEGRESFSVG
jgi:L-Ala-D/L-Glu epimerase